jgi:hypothetical protein
MNTISTIQFRRTLISLVSAAAIALPGLASARLGDRIQTVKTNAGIHITNVRENRPLVKAIEKVTEPATDIFHKVQELQVMEQFQDTMALVNKMQADYQYFSGGHGCSATCASFRASLKNIFNDFSSLVADVPALSGNQELVANIQRTSDLIDYIPPRALYLMWQAMSAKVAELEAMAYEIRATLDSLPPLMDPSGFGPNTRTASTNTQGSATRGDRMCEWVNEADKPVIELIQARLEMLGWEIEKLEGMIPDVSVKGEAGASAGAAVANGTASAGASAKPTDIPKIGLKVIAYVPQRINWAIKINMLHAKVACS